MAANPRPISYRLRRLSTAAGGAFLTLGLLWAGAASAYVGDSFISIPGITGHWQGTSHANWIRAEASEWTGVQRRRNSGAATAMPGDKLYFGGPNAARPGAPGKLVVMLGINNPDRALLMDMCAKKTPIPELTYSESSDLARPPLEFGSRPAELPAYWQYRLKGAEIADCPFIEGASDHAFVLTFKDIDWLNYDPKRPSANKIVFKPGELPDVRPVEPSAKKKVRAFVMTWFAPATDATPDQCPVMNAKPSEADIFRYMSKEQVAQILAKNGEKRINYGLESEMRGPHRLNVNSLPGIIPDPGLHEPQSPIAFGIDLDGDDGTGPPPPGIRKHKNYVSHDGRTGIDNQFYTVTGCVPGFRGKQGYRNQTSNARRADGNVVTLVEISGIDDEKNDDRVDVAIIYARDKPIRDNAGSKFIPNYTFRATDDPNFILYNRRVRGRIVNGVVTTEAMAQFGANLGLDPYLELFNARMRFELLADGSMKGVLAGYRRWRKHVGDGSSGSAESLFNYQGPALYYAFKRNADGLPDPVTGEFNGISIVYEIDGVPAFLTPAPPAALSVAQGNVNTGKAQ